MAYGRPLLGDLLVEKFGLSPAKRDELLALQREKGGRLGELLLKARALREEDLLQAVAQQLDVPWLPHLQPSMVDHALLAKVPISFARRYRLLPLRLEAGRILVATPDPLETAALDDLRLLLGHDVTPAVPVT